MPRQSNQEPVFCRCRKCENSGIPLFSRVTEQRQKARRHFRDHGSDFNPSFIPAKDIFGADDDTAAHDRYLCFCKECDAHEQRSGIRKELSLRTVQRHAINYGSLRNPTYIRLEEGGKLQQSLGLLTTTHTAVIVNTHTRKRSTEADVTTLCRGQHHPRAYNIGGRTSRSRRPCPPSTRAACRRCLDERRGSALCHG